MDQKEVFACIHLSGHIQTVYYFPNDYTQQPA